MTQIPCVKLLKTLEQWYSAKSSTDKEWQKRVVRKKLLRTFKKAGQHNHNWN